jgi:hypothetical protein
VQGRGYHFDSLLRQTTVREAEPTVETDARPDATMYSRSTSDNMDGTKKDADRRAEEVFVKLAWRLCRCSFDIPWLEALLLNLLFHGYLSLGPTATAAEKAQHQLCRSCQRHLQLEQKPDTAEAQTLDLQSCLAAALCFLLGTSKTGVNADVYVHDADTTDLNVPRESYRIGSHDSLLVPIFRLLFPIWSVRCVIAGYARNTIAAGASIDACKQLFQPRDTRCVWNGRGRQKQAQWQYGTNARDFAALL